MGGIFIWSSMTFEDLRSHFLPKGNIAIAHWLMVSTKVVSEWERNNSIPENYLVHVEQQLRELKVFKSLKSTEQENV